MNNHNHTDQLDRQFEQAHRVFSNDHDALRDDLFERINDAPSGMSLGASPFSPSNRKWKWIMRSTIGAAAAIVIVAWISLFGTGPVATTVAWADVRENLENATASYSVSYTLILDSQGELTQPPIKMSEHWDSEEVHRHKALTSEGEVSFERITGDFMFELNHKRKFAELTYSRTYPEPLVNPVEAESGQSPQLLDFIPRLSDGYAKHVEEAVLNGQAVDLYEVQVSDLIAFEVDQTGKDPRDDPEKVAMIKIYEGLSPLRIWVNKADVLPVRIEIPMLPRETKELDIPEGGRAVQRIDFLAWNQKVDPAMFDPVPPDGWYFEHWERIGIGTKKLLSAKTNLVGMTGLPLAEGVPFRLLGPQGQVLIDDPSLVTVAGVTHRTGYDLGNPQIEPWDMLHLSLRFSDDVMKRLQETLGRASEAHWTFSLGEMTGTIRGYLKKPRDGGEEHRLHLDAFKIDRVDPQAVLDLLETES